MKRFEYVDLILLIDVVACEWSELRRPHFTTLSASASSALLSSSSSYSSIHKQHHLPSFPLLLLPHPSAYPTAASVSSSRFCITPTFPFVEAPIQRAETQTVRSSTYRVLLLHRCATLLWYISLLEAADLCLAPSRLCARIYAQRSPTSLLRSR